MTDKQIIINRIDVSECEHYTGNIDYLTNKNWTCRAKIQGTKCEDCPNCYYKQLKRSEAQCEDMFVKHTDLEMKYKQKEQECERLKEDLRRSFKEKDTLHLIIDRLLEASGYDANTASEEDFEDVYEHMRYEQQQLNQLKAELEQEKALKETYLACYKTKHEDIEGELFKLREYKKSKQASYEEMQKRWNDVELENRKLKQTLTEIKEYFIKECAVCKEQYAVDDYICSECQAYKLLQKISEVIKDE